MIQRSLAILAADVRADIAAGNDDLSVQQLYLDAKPASRPPPSLPAWTRGWLGGLLGVVLVVGMMGSWFVGIALLTLSDQGGAPRRVVLTALGLVCTIAPVVAGGIGWVMSGHCVARWPVSAAEAGDPPAT
jgi:hypothetical protein